MGLEKSKILVIGGTGKIGKAIVMAGAKSGHSTSVLVRKSTVADPVKAKLIDGFKKSGVALVYGDLYDHESLVKAIKQVDVVISVVGSEQIPDQLNIIAAIKEAGNVKRFFPSEFGIDVDNQRAVEPAKSLFTMKAKIRRAIEAQGIPHTYVVCNCCATYFLSTFVQKEATVPPREKLTIFGDGTPKAFITDENDIGTYTIKSMDDPRTLNKILYVRAPKNCCSFNDLVSIWEKKIDKTIEKTYVPNEQLLKIIQDAPSPIDFLMAVVHSVFVNGDLSNFEIEPSVGVEATKIYPEVKYTTVDEYLDRFI